MTVFNTIFYLAAAVVISATGLAITRKSAVHAVCYLVISFMGTAVLFYILGAPLLAALEVIIYAGGIMVLFLFVVMMVKDQRSPIDKPSRIKQWLPAIVLAGISAVMAGLLVFADPGNRLRPPAVMGTPQEFGKLLFQEYWFPVEIASILLLAALIGALYLGRRKDHSEDTP
ncbi:MAG: NADH-quinone oxidoreductase subunit J [Deltaproteobacteria bacterium]|nr:NADH-quinone oxidoreductase subunit J [Deltaproteobacteria bacterium]